MTQLLDELHAKGLAAAQTHFNALVVCMHSVLPDGVNETIPKTLEDVAGLFSASTKEFYLTILPNTPGYSSMSAVFELCPALDGVPYSWTLKKFSVMIGSTTMFSMPREYVAHTLEDALVMSKQIITWQEKYAAEHPAIASIPDFPGARPN